MFAMTMVALSVMVVMILARLRLGARVFAWHGDVLGQKTPCCVRVEAVNHVGGLALCIPRDRDPGDDGGLGAARPQEVRPARVAVAGATIARGRILGEAQPGGIDGIE